MRKLLRYLWEQRDAVVSEYAIATEGLERSADFDSSADASVRVQISRLRRKLKDFYTSETDEPEMLQIPTGTHQLIVVESAAALRSVVLPSLLVESAAPVLPPSPRNLQRKLLPMLGCLCLLLLVCDLWLLRRNGELTRASSPVQKTNIFWSSFLGGDAPVKIILPTPVFFSFERDRTIRLRSTEVNNFDERDRSPEFKALTANMGEPHLEQSYTVTSDTLAAIDLARYLDSIGQSRRISFDVTRDSSMLALEQANVVAVGTHATLRPFSNYLTSMNFSLSKDEAWVDNARPAAGEQSRYEITHVSTNRQIEPSIIALLPGQAPGLKLLVLQSRHTGAIVSFLTSNTGSNLIETMLKAHGTPAFFEIVVLSECEGNNAVRSWPVAAHAYAQQPPSSAM